MMFLKPGLYSRELSAVLPSVLLAGKAVDEIYRTPFSVQWKAEDDPLTEADLAANRIIVDSISSNFPNDSVLSEEIKDNKNRLTKERVWIIDPIDGTREFVRKNPEFAISVGLVDNSKAVLGIILNPATRELFFGTLDSGTYYSVLKEDFTIDSSSIQGPIKIDLFENKLKPTLLISQSEKKDGFFDSDPFWNENFSVHPMGSIAYKLGLVAAGKSDFTVSVRPKSEWDVCGGIALVLSSKGSVYDLNAEEYSFNKDYPIDSGIIAGNFELVNSLVQKHSAFFKESFRPRS